MSEHTVMESLTGMAMAPPPLFDNFRPCMTNRQRVYAVLRAIKRALFGLLPRRKAQP